jgi:hypothetical protein
MTQSKDKFYLGRNIENQAPVLYDPDDLTTHAVVVGMTGSGKTGLCIDLLEEAALRGIPALMIDLKGDITNALLHFPDLLPVDFQPWVNADAARRAGQTLEQAAASAAEAWSQGLAKWGISKERVLALKNAAQFAVYTPGSDAGIPVSILASLRWPMIPWQGNEELLREKISGTVTAILGLVGIKDIDPVRSREHILLANIFEKAWSQRKDLELSELILQTQTPPFEKLGVFDIGTFFPEKDRFELAMLLNNILAAPTFQAWISGQPLDVHELLYGRDGRPRHSVFYIAHLSDAERMFFVTLLYGAVETWMRAQKGATSLRALVYFDDIYGYMPPVANPPSKGVMLRMLKQGRAFGVGQILATQNPVDVDYKGLSNAGTWFVGKLQTENDKQRLLDGLQGASNGVLDRGHYDQLIAGLGKREFLLHNVHEEEPQVFMTRWAMNYLAGPLTRNQIPVLNELAGASYVPSEPMAATQPMASLAETQPSQVRPPEPGAVRESGALSTRPSAPAGVAEYFLPNNLTMMEAFRLSGKPLPDEAMSQGLVYKPVLLAQADVRYLQRKYNLDHEETYIALVPDPDRRGVVRWEDYLTSASQPLTLDTQPAPGSRFGVLEAPLSDGKVMKTLQGDFLDWAYRRSSATVFGNSTLGLYAGPPTTEGEFRKRVSEEVRKMLDDEIQKLKGVYQKKFTALQHKLDKEKREMEEDRAEHAQRTMEEIGTLFENIFSKRVSGRRISTSLRKHRMTTQARADMKESEEVIEEIETEMDSLQEEAAAAINEAEDKWEEVAAEIEEISVTPFKKDILIDTFGVAWMPYHVVDVGGMTMEMPGFSAK